MLSLDFRLCHQVTVKLILVKLEIENKSSAFWLKRWTEIWRNSLKARPRHPKSRWNDFRQQKPNWKLIWIGLGALREPGKVSLESLECLSKSWRSPWGWRYKSCFCFCLVLLFVVCCVCCLLLFYLFLITFWFFPSNGNSIPFDVWACCLSSEDLCFSRIRPKALPWMLCHWAQASLQARGMPGWRNRASTIWPFG